MASEADEKDAIRDVLSEYCFCLDGGHFAEMAALFTEDGVWDTAFGKGVGRAGIEALARKLRASRPSGAEHRGVHLVGNIVIRLDGGSAIVRSNWVLAQNGPAGPMLGAAGGYADAMVKQGDAWRFRVRRIDRFIAADLNPAPLT